MRRDDVVREIARALAVVQIAKERGKERTATRALTTLASRLGVYDEVTSGKIARQRALLEREKPKEATT